ncbi:alpha-(1,3)-fucosyltransferase C isoform X2 [Cephus cinctus]|uniref:Fucosyltransferase n=1 Tax=Cephus cinctus TaxID=211228 RepID=A0AAJ7RVQ4_CEPCN|nr:alpha-(1,3)-fucosyltransferase C isoform X2 [Cephus cinctus]
MFKYILRYCRDDSRRVKEELPNEENTRTEHGSAIKTILYWNKMHGEQEKYFYFGHGDIFKGCPVPHCYATNKRDYHESLTDFDAILFHGVEMVKGDIPKVRSPNQRYVFFTWESAASRPINNHVFELTPNYYNWTMGFRMDSDIPRPYAVVRDRNTNEIVAPSSKEVSWREPEDTFSDPELDNLVKEKTKMAAWFVSHCNTISKRDALVAALRKYIRVDIYGACGSYKCDKNQDCYGMLEKEYYFYISFENTLCVDYVTEKLYEILKRNVIPVVYGGANYTRFAPPRSYVNVEDFKNAETLAAFLKKLASDPAEYRKYFWWKRYYAIEDSKQSTLCKFCEMLHDKNLPRKSLLDFRKYYLDGQCHLPDPRWFQK